MLGIWLSYFNGLSKSRRSTCLLVRKKWTRRPSKYLFCSCLSELSLLRRKGLFLKYWLTRNLIANQPIKRYILWRVKFSAHIVVYKMTTAIYWISTPKKISMTIVKYSRNQMAVQLKLVKRIGKRWDSRFAFHLCHR